VLRISPARRAGSGRFRRGAGIAIVAALTLAGCGTSVDRAQVSSVTTRFVTALDARRGGEACLQLSPALRQTLQQHNSPSRCAAAVTKLKTQGSPINAVHVYATSARADLADGVSVFLSAMRDGWRIDAVGCRPQSSGPYRCEEQG
jgi:hypothetical protein